MAVDKHITQIYTNKLFSHCNQSIYSVNLSPRNFTEYKDADIIFRAGEKSNYIFLVVSGEVKIKFTNYNRVIYRGRNEFFGDVELTKEVKRFSSAVAIDNCLIYKIDSDTFKKLSRIDRQILVNIQSVERIDLKNGDGEKDKLKQELPSLIDLDRSTIKLDLFKSKKKETPVNNAEKTEADEKAKLEDEIEQIRAEVEPELPDLNSIIQEPKKKTIIDDKLKQELLGDSEDFSNWDLQLVEEEPQEQEKNVVKSESDTTSEPLSRMDSFDKEYLQKELNLLRYQLTDQYTSVIRKINRILPEPTLAESLERIATEFVEFTSSSYVRIFLVNDKSGTLEIAYPDNITLPSIEIGTGLTGKAVELKKVLFIKSPHKDIRFNREFDLPVEFEKASVAYIPLNDSEHKLVGLIQLGKTNKDFSKQEEEALKLIARHAGIMVRHSIFTQERIRQQKLSAFGSISNFLMNDIKSPVLTIKHYSNLLSKADISQDIKKVLTMLTMQANSVIDLMQATFDFSENKSTLKIEKTNFNTVMDDILELLSEYTESKNVKLYKKLGDDVTLEIDPRRFYVVFFQIVKNACESMPTGGRIFINTEKVDKTVLIKIRDEGPGISSGLKDDIFSAFFSHGKEGASGLGLSISRYIVQAMNGTISYSSKEKEGTTFELSFPILES